MKWFRLYHDIINDPKIMMLSEEYRWRYVAFLCIASLNDPRGKLPDVNEIAFKLRMELNEVVTTIEEFKEAKLIIRGKINAWDKRQYISDDVNLRVTKHREKQNGNVSGSNHVTPPDTETETDSDIQRDSKPKVKLERNIIPPTFEMVKAYLKTVDYVIDIQHFLDFYTKKGWKVGKNKIVDWHGAVGNAKNWDHNINYAENKKIEADKKPKLYLVICPECGGTLMDSNFDNLYGHCPVCEFSPFIPYSEGLEKIAETEYVDPDDPDEIRIIIKRDL